MLAAIAALLLLSATPAGIQEILTNESVLALSGAGLSDAVIVAKIRSSQVDFRLDTKDLIALRKRGVSAPVIEAMIEASAGSAKALPPDEIRGGGPDASVAGLASADPMKPHPPGVYLFVEGAPPRMQSIDATVSSQVKTGGILGFALTAGIASASFKATIPNAGARTRTPDSTPTFYFFFDTSRAGNGSGGLGGGGMSVMTPNEFTLIRLTQKKGQREAKVGKSSLGGAKVGVMEKDRIEFDYEMVRQGVYRVMPSTKLLPGEYGFLFPMSGAPAMGGAMTARIFDFSVMQQ